METITEKKQSNTPSDAFDALTDLPGGFLSFYCKLHEKFFPWQQQLISKRKEVLHKAHRGVLPDHLSVTEINTGDWKINLPAWITDQRNQMTGPADDAALVVKMLNSSAPGVMIDLEDSMANTWENLVLGCGNSIKALYGELAYDDEKRGLTVGIKPGSAITFIRVRGLHMHQNGILEGATSASLFDVAMLAYLLDFSKLKHPLCFYIPKSESAEEALWWSALFKEMATYKGVNGDYIKCMALVESHPLAFQIEEFIYNLQDHLLGLNLGRWDYMASLIHFNLNDPAWVLPDRNTIPADIAFFQNLRHILPELCHKRGIFAIGGMTALFPDRSNAALNERAIDILQRDKKNEADCGFDGAWTGHPDQNQAAIDQFPQPNQLTACNPDAARYPDLRPKPAKVGVVSLAGSQAAARVTILYRYGVLKGKGASLIDGYMEDLATDRIYRLMLTQRCMHHHTTPVTNESGQVISHDLDFLTKLFDTELHKILKNVEDDEDRHLYSLARYQTEEMIRYGWHDPV